MYTLLLLRSLCVYVYYEVWLTEIIVEIIYLIPGTKLTQIFAIINTIKLNGICFIGNK